MTPQHLSLDQKPHSYRFPPSSPDRLSDDMDTAPDEAVLPSLPGRRLTRASRSQANSKSLRIDTEQLRNLSILDKSSAKQATRSFTAEMRQQQFQKLCEFLWKTGRANLGKRDSPHVNIAPVRLLTTQDPSYDSVTIYSVVHSQGHSPVGLRRKFDRSLLNATVPEPLQSPSTPNFDRNELLSAIVDTSKTLASRRSRKSPRSSLSSRGTRTRRDVVPDGIPMRTLISSRFPPQSSKALTRVVHTDFPYARSYLPILASIIMSNQVHFGDTVELPLPYPDAWPETVAWVYTGEEELVTDKVRENVQYLGGRVC
ncbi:hypothetical protein A9K55_007538 [Cordyceps militaris]|uniref:Uncharacterized protein n=1 Tax=Cordyceps militaris TaxID=73501 RepID=A0A2H4SHS2_CORMI|nr:hypothetical protein A9K55_007538 [Cordyceps militaris]